MAEDLKRLLNNEPIQAKRPSFLDRLAKTCRRHSSVVASIIVLSVIAVCGLVFATGRIHHERTRALKNLDIARDALDRERSMRREAERMRDLAEKSDVRRLEALHVSDMKLAGQAWKNGDLRQCAAFLDRYRPVPGEMDLRGFAWHYLWRCTHMSSNILAKHQDYVYWTRCSPDGRWLASAGWDGRIRLIDLSTQQQEFVLSPGYEMPHSRESRSPIYATLG